MTGVDLDRLEATLGRRLTRREVRLLREAADRVAASRSFDSALATLRQAHPAAVSPAWGIA